MTARSLARSERPLRVSEVFDSLQGEGASTGKPCRFFRLALCNLHCHYCDTKYTWDFERFRYEEEVQEWSIEDAISRLADAPSRHLVVTGGEPLMQQRELAAMFERLPRDFWIEIETNGTLAPSAALASRVDQWNVSPKLASAGDPEALRIREHALLALRDTERGYLKLVVNTEADRDEAEALRARLAWRRDRTLLMPEATTPEELAERSPRVAAWALALGVRFSSRLHVALWGGRRGV